MSEKEKVIYLKSKLMKLSQENMNHYKKDVFSEGIKRGRVCTHSEINNTLHEMFIFSKKSKYVRPHKNKMKNKSYHIIDGLVDIIYFSKYGKINKVIHLGDYNSGFPFYLRLVDSGYHTIVTLSDVLIIKETIDGPFKPSDTIYASWAPDENDIEGGKAYLKSLYENIIKTS